ncbi:MULTISPECIES: thiol-disulfide oxidoreductase DCC family protein [Cellulophaga]|uniref:Thiol-disulfide oxidoreductase DCC n=2 Tax=Cellulophaga TaxID=104264 RepID=F0RBJ5_CELLC|nr:MULTISPECIES: thiol-disulfide oxidoreductase DCC family protein [Cellulophaga]ADY30645.1 thiol-disulfide oxidoreductase DCC [Cellulophaga lytica DSM 7489]AIM61629.1 thiol-disulfide oxidoreductase [Cellulophaga lytica]APU11524.1 thiol-disulfide oxidoreductase [Cellulophaga lytica]EWH14801.1 thiol-disulfide oxidoreductase DCC [Cellulophaga geojensis KL-A]MDO6853106.1 thiol-disulfide oxidoreductase DCC family protein [Cellulophaga lytica]
MDLDKKIILFDGVCNLCNNAIQFIIKHDKKDEFRFATLQGEIAHNFFSTRNIDMEKTDSIILIEPNIAYYVKSSAALKIGRSFGGIWSLLWILELIPASFRDWIYTIIAKNRYNWFGKKNNCMIPTPELKSKFLD